jgi:hypothetical protein
VWQKLVATTTGQMAERLRRQLKVITCWFERAWVRFPLCSFFASRRPEGITLFFSFWFQHGRSHPVSQHPSEAAKTVALVVGGATHHWLL